MRLIEIAIASVNTTVGATKQNTERMLRLVDQAKSATLVVFHEQVFGGYPAEDLVQWHAFVNAQQRALSHFAEHTAKSRAVFVVGLVVAHEAQRYNCAAVVHAGRVLGVVPKEKLPTYNVFYETRTFSPGVPFLRSAIWDGVPFGDLVFEFDWGTLGVEVCEDAWTPDGPMSRRTYSGAEVIANVSASPYRLGAQATRREMLATRSSDNQTTLVYANQVGGQDGLIFDGGGFVCQNGRVALEAPRFVQGITTTVVDLDRTTRLRAENTTWRVDQHTFAAKGQRSHAIAATTPGAERKQLKYPAPKSRSFFLPSDGHVASNPRRDFCEELLDALALGVGDYFEKNKFKLIGVALSGGRDSVLTLLIAWRYLEKRFQLDKHPEKKSEAAALLRTFYMPTRFSSNQTHQAAQTIAAELGAPFTVIPVEEAFEREVKAAEAMLQAGEKVTPITEQNIQARIRGTRMWNWSNSTAGLFLQTGNMSEKAMGYTTIGGDLEGCVSVIANVPKTVVMYLLDYLAETTGSQGIKQCLGHHAGPELAANQKGEEELMPFPVLDACFSLYAQEKLAPDELLQALAAMFPEHAEKTLTPWVERFVKLFHQSIYKWVQAPLCLHVGNLDLDRERALQLPVVSSNEWNK